MSDPKRQTIDTYNKSAKELAEYFRGIGSRVDDIERTFKLAGGGKNPRTLEIGCGDGRDAKEIVKHTRNYIGFDISKALIEIAQSYVPDTTFKVADAEEYAYPKNLDVVFAFASLLHLDKQALKKVLGQVYDSLRPGGVFFISLKYAQQYKQEMKHDSYGSRMFYYYNPEIIIAMADKYEVLYLNASDEFVTVGNTHWFDICLRKPK